MHDGFTGRRSHADLAILSFNVETIVRLELWFDLHIKGKLAGNSLNSRLAQARSQAQTIAGVILAERRLTAL